MAVKNDASTGGPQKADQQFEQNGFAAPAFADDDERLPSRHVKMDVPQDFLFAEAHRNVVEGDERSVGGRQVGHRTHSFSRGACTARCKHRG